MPALCLLPAGPVGPGCLFCLQLDPDIALFVGFHAGVDKAHPVYAVADVREGPVPRLPPLFPGEQDLRIGPVDISEGFIELNNSPRTRRVKSVFFAMRYPIDKPNLRAQRMETMRELFRQFMSKLILEDTKLKERQLYLDTRIRFSEIPEYFASGCACARFQIGVDLFTDLRLNPDEWITHENTQEP